MSSELSSNGIEQVIQLSYRVNPIEALTDNNFNSQERRSLTLVSIRATGRTSSFIDTMYLVQNWVLYLDRDARTSLPVRRIFLGQGSPT
jgi:hypothetical protein